MVLRSPCGTPLANNAGSTLIHTPTPSSTLMGVAAQRSSKSLAMASRMSTTGGLSKTLNCKSLIQNMFFSSLFVCFAFITYSSVCITNIISEMHFQLISRQDPCAMVTSFRLFME